MHRIYIFFICAIKSSRLTSSIDVLCSEDKVECVGTVGSYASLRPVDDKALVVGDSF